MAIASVRIYYGPARPRLARYLSFTHWGFAEWIERRLAPIREQLHGPEVEGVDIVNFLLSDPSRALFGGQHGQWTRVLNAINFIWVCDLEPLRDQPPIENIERLMRFAGAWAGQAPWPQVRALGDALSQPLTGVERSSLLPYLTWPRESLFRSLGLEGERFEAAMEKGRRDAAPAMREARYPTPRFQSRDRSFVEKLRIDSMTPPDSSTNG